LTAAAISDRLGPSDVTGRWQRFALACCVAAASLSHRAWAQAPSGELPPDRQVPILTRALAYDDNLKARAGDELVVAVLAKPGNSLSDQAAEGVHRAFKGLAGIKVQGLPLRAIRLNFTGGAHLVTAIQSQGIDALYLSPGLETDLGTILEVSKQQHVLSLGSRPDHINKGVSLGVFLIAAKPTICVNLGASKAEGAAFGSDLLRLAKVVR
jgi:hypothetical protein